MGRGAGVLGRLRGLTRTSTGPMALAAAKAAATEASLVASHSMGEVAPGNPLANSSSLAALGGPQEE